MGAQAGGASYFGCRVKAWICLLRAFFSGERSVGPAWGVNQSHGPNFPQCSRFLSKEGRAGRQCKARPGGLG